MRPNWLPSLIDENVGRFRLLLTLYSFQASKLVAFKEVNAVGAAFEPADGDGALGQIEIVPSHITCLRYPKPMAVYQKPDHPITMAMPIGLERSQQLGNLGFGEMFTSPIDLVRFAASRCNTNGSAF